MSKRGWLLFAAMSLIWGVPYLLIRVAVRDISPPTLVFARTALGAALLLPVAARRGVLRPLLPKWRPMLVYSAIEIAIPWLLLSQAEKRLSSSLSGLLVAMVPLIGAVILRFTSTSGHDDRLDRRRVAGLLVGLVGVVVLLGADVSTHDAWAVVEIVVTSIGYAAGPILIARQLKGLPSLGVVAASLAVTAVAYLPIAVMQAPVHITAETAWSVVGLAVICTAVAFLVFFRLIAEVGPARSTVITYVNPAIALLLGVLLLSEPFTVGIAVGFPLILLGCYVATSANRTASRAKNPAPATAATPAQCSEDPVGG